ncbi:MAG: glucokinase [Nitrospirota bacterium]|jgi:glucokinase
MAEILAADIGGTNSRFAHFGTGEGGRLSLVGTHWLNTGDYPSFEALLGGLVDSGFGLAPGGADIAVIAAAGPIERNGKHCSPPFIDWDIDISSPGELGLRRAALINDFVAQAWAVKSPVGDSAREVLPGRAVAGGAVAVIGAGTGLGQAALVPDGEGGYAAAPSEGGHAEFPLSAGRECEFAEFVRRDTGHQYPTGNTVVSGEGLSRLHEFLTGRRLGPREVASRLAGDSETLRWAARLFGRACRDYALQVLATGGLYIAGGVAARTPAIVEHGEFGAEFRSSPKMAEVLSEIPVYLVTDQDSGLWGAGLYGLGKLGKKGEGG